MDYAGTLSTSSSIMIRPMVGSSSALSLVAGPSHTASEVWGVEVLDKFEGVPLELKGGVEALDKSEGVH